MQTQEIPNKVEFESSVLCSCMRGDAERVCGLLSANDFYLDKHKKIFAAITDLVKNGVDPEEISVGEKLKESGNLSDVGGVSYLAEITEFPIATNIEYFCGKIRDEAIKFDLLKACNALAQKCRNGHDLQELVDESKSVIESISNRSVESNGTKTVAYKDLIVEASDRYEKLYANKQKYTGIPSGFGLLDYYLCGFQQSDLIVLAARTSMGKTALALTIAGNMAKHGEPCAYFSLEMSASQLIDRQISAKTNINLQKFRSGRFEKEDWHKIQAAWSQLYDWPVYVDDSSGLHYREIQRRAWKLKKKHGIKAIFVDHLQHVKGDRESTRDREIGSITLGLKIAAKDLDIPVILLSQLNRSIEGRPEGKKRPIISDLRDSGNIEQDADVIMFIYRPAVYQEKEKFPGQTEIIIAKQRNGPLGTIDLKWDDRSTTFLDIDKRANENEY